MKQKIELEYELKSKSAKLIWQLIGTDSGWKKWLANDVKTIENEVVFTWGNPMKEHQSHTATILEHRVNGLIRFHWNDDEEETYWEMKLVKNELDDYYHLKVTDFAEKDEVGDLIEIWNENMERFRTISGI